MTILFLLCFSLLDFQHPPKPESPLAGFVVNDAVDNSALTGCTMNPSSGIRFNADMISVDWVNNNDPHEDETSVSHLPASHFDLPGSIETMSMRPPVEPGPPDPTPPSPAATPEPPTVAILGISGIALLYLLFGRKRQKLYRRP